MIRDDRLHRIDANRLQVANDHGIDAVLFANDDVPVESAAVTELLEMLNLQQTIERTAEAVPDAFDLPPTITQVAVTPDFHKARAGFRLAPSLRPKDLWFRKQLATTSIAECVCTSPP